jgi:hypothetical protein
MFQLDDRATPESLLAQAIIDGAGLSLEPSGEHLFAITFYRLDAQDGYPFLTAFAGLREPEPMFGPPNWDDFRLRAGGVAVPDSPFGFCAREGTRLIRSVVMGSWALYINGRGNPSPLAIKRIEQLCRVQHQEEKAPKAASEGGA